MSGPFSVVVSGLEGSDAALARAVARRLQRAGLVVVDHDAGEVGEGVAAVLHLGGATSASKRLDDALTEDLYETEALIARATETGAPFLFGSRTSVAGGKKGLIAEVDPRTVSFGASAVKGADVDVAAERASLTARVAFARAQVQHADRTAARRQTVRDAIAARGGPSHGKGYEAAVDDAAHAELGALLRQALTERASGWGFPTSSTPALRGFTRGLGELMASAASASVAVTLLRLPSLLVPQAEGDDDDAFSLQPLFERVQDGALRLPFAPRARVEALPLDVVADAVAAVVQAAVVKGPAQPLSVVHVVSSDKNPLTCARLTDLLDLHLRRSSNKPLLARALSVDDTAPLPPVIEQGASAAASLASTFVEALNRRVPSKAGTEVATTLRSLSSAKDTALCQAPPFFSDEVRFAQRGLRMTCTRAGLPLVDPATIDWREHLLGRHFPALQRRRAARLAVKDKKPVAAYDSLAHLLLESAARHKHRAALSLFEAGEEGAVVDVSYAELVERSCAAALRLEQAGVQAGDRVVVAASNHPDWSVVSFGALLLRATLVPLDANIEPDAARNVLAKAKPKLVVVDKGVRARLDGVLQEPVLDLHLTAVSGPGIDPATRTLPSSTDLASILFTSGTTGEPKGVMLSHGNFCALIGSLLAVFEIRGQDRMLSVLPLHHTFEFTCGLLMPLAAGATVYTPDAIVGERVLYALKAGKITAIVGVPALWQLLERRITKQAQDRGALASSVFQSLLDINKKLGTRFGVSAGKLLLKPVHDQLGGHLRTLISGGSALPPAVHEMFQGLGLPLAEGYGLTESAPVLTVAEGKMGLPAGTVGHAVPGVTLQLVDVDSGKVLSGKGAVGEIWARAPNIMQGYFENESATDAVLTKDGWLKTGDLGTIAPDGTVRIVGRSKDVVVAASGENIYLDDVEKKLEHIPGVLELTLLGLPDPKGGERLACIFVASVADERGVDVATKDPTQQQKARQQLQQRLLKLPGWQRPAVVDVYDEVLPRTASRKVKRRELKKWLEALLQKREAEEAAAAATSSSSNVVTLSPARLAIARTAGVDVSKVQASTSLPADLGFDSLMWVELQGQLEPIAGRKIDPEVLVTKETVVEIEALLRDVRDGSLVSKNVEVTEAAGEEADAMPPLVREALELVIKEPSIKAGRASVSFFQQTLFSQGFKTTIEGSAFVPANRNVIVVANHSSHLDTGLVKYALGDYAQELRPLAAKDYFFEGNPLKVAFFEHLTNLVPIDRETGSGLAFEQARDVVEAGHIVLIFPEGTRREDGTLGSFKPLVAKLAMATGVDVLPLHLRGCFDAFPRGASFPKFGSSLTATIGPPLPASELKRLTAHLPPVQAARSATDIIRRAVVALRDGRALELSRARSLEDLDGATRAVPQKASSQA